MSLCFSACGEQWRSVHGVQVQWRGKFSALLSMVLWYHRSLPQPLWARNAHTLFSSLLLRALGETLPTPKGRHRHTSKDKLFFHFSIGVSGSHIGMSVWAVFLTASVFFSWRSWTVTEVVALAVLVSGRDGCIHWITTGVWKMRIQSFPLVRGPLSLSGVPYPGHHAQATTPQTLSKPLPARAVPAPPLSTLKVRSDERKWFIFF